LHNYFTSVDFTGEFVDQCKNVVKYFKNHHVPKARLARLQEQSNTCQLALSSPTRWCSVVKLCNSLLDNGANLRVIVTARDFIIGTSSHKNEQTHIRDIVIAPDFLSQLFKVMSIVGPVDKLIVKYQSDKEYLFF
jgi:hypothetical protein